MIDRQQLVAALERLDPRELEVLDLSLRRRVPDDDLASVYGLDPGEVARRRTAAIERLSKELDIQRGADLGHMLQTLLEPETWQDLILTEPEEDEPAEREPGPGEPMLLHREPAAEPEAETESQAETEPEAETEAEAEPEPDADLEPELQLAEDAAVSGPSAEESAAEAPALPLEEAEPVLEMLGARLEAREDRGRRNRRLTVGLAAAATVLLPAAGLVAAATLGGERDPKPGSDDGSQTRRFTPAPQGPLSQPFATEATAAPGYTVARIRQKTVLYDAPGGNTKLRIAARTEWNSARVMGVVRQRGDWLAVQVPELDNGDVAWLKAEEAEVSTEPWSLHADLSKRELIVRRDGHFVRRMSIAIGAPAHPTPEGRYSVTDKLRVSDSDSPYGCCVLALTGHQDKLPQGWPGGDRLAVHATRDLSSIGRPVSLGCMRAETEQAEWLLNRIPLGAPIFVSA